MINQQTKIFISYSRVDSEFVDRLDVYLHTRNYRTWVDRYRLEGGVDWEREINIAIAACDLFLIVLSRSVVNSPYVRQEFEEASRLSKRIIPILYQNCDIPTWFDPANHLHRSDFTDPRLYERNLEGLLYSIQDPTLDLSADTNQLYNRALPMRATDPERAVIILQHIIGREPTYFGGQAQRNLADLETQLYDSRVLRLRAQAERAQQEGQYDLEAESLKALLALGDRDASAIAWAREYLPIAQQNRKMVGPYVGIQKLLEDKDIVAARTGLLDLWKQAPYFRDPANIAPALGLNLPPTYAHDKAVAAEQERFERACDILSGNTTEIDLKRTLADLQRLHYDLDDMAATLLIELIIHSQRQSQSLNAKRNRPDPVPYWIQSSASHLASYLTWIVIVITILGIYEYGYYALSDPVDSPIAVPYVTAVFIPLETLAIGALIGLRNLAGTGRVDRRNKRLQQAEDQARGKAEAAYQEWKTLAEKTYRQRIDAINRDDA